MTEPIRLLEFGIVPYLRSQAIYHAVADAMRVGAPDTIILLAPDRPHFCVGYHQDPRQELDLEFCAAHDYPILRRRVGGGATYLDSNQLYYQFLFHHSRAPALVDKLYEFALAGVVDTLGALGLNSELRGINEILANGKRIAGTGAGRIGEASVVVGNILLDFNYTAMARAWNVPNEAFRRLAREGLEKYITTLRREMKAPPGLNQLQDQLVECLYARLGRPLVRESLSGTENQLVTLAEQELASQDRLFEIQGDTRSELKIAGGVYVYYSTCYLLVGGGQGELTVTARVSDKLIDAITIVPAEGFGGRIWDILGSALVGLSLEPASIQAAFERFQTSGLIPEEINLGPLIRTIVKFGR